MKFLPNDLRQAKYKNVRLDSIKIYFSLFWDERSRTSSSECFLQPWTLHLGVKQNLKHVKSYFIHLQTNIQKKNKVIT